VRSVLPWAKGTIEPCSNSYAHFRVERRWTRSRRSTPRPLGDGSPQKLPLAPSIQLVANEFNWR
jgi:hypothetical protein